MRLSSVMSSGSSPLIRYARKGYVHVASAKYTWTGESSAAGVLSFASAGFFGVVRFGLIDLCSMRSKNIPGGICDLVEPRFAHMSASSLLSRPMWPLQSLPPEN